MKVFLAGRERGVRRASPSWRDGFRRVLTG